MIFNNDKPIYLQMADRLSDEILAGTYHDDERILCYNYGVALHDVYFAAKIYEQLKDSSNSFVLSVPEKKTWL